MASPSSSSDEEDVFSCGKCRAEFYKMDEFMAHKKSKVCRKKQLPDGSTSSTRKTPARHRNNSESNTVKIVESTDDGIPADLFEETNSAGEEGDLIIDDQGHSPGATKPSCQFCEQSFETHRAILEHYKKKHNIPEDLAPPATVRQTITSLENWQSRSLRTNSEGTVTGKRQFTEISGLSNYEKEHSIPEDLAPPGTLRQTLTPIEKWASQSLHSNVKREGPGKCRLTESSGLSQTTVTCDVCTTSFQSKAKLKVHLRSRGHKSKVTALNKMTENSRSEVMNEVDTAADGGTGSPKDCRELGITVSTRPKVCAICKEKLSTSKELVDHLSRVHHSPRRSKSGVEEPADSSRGSPKDNEELKSNTTKSRANVCAICKERFSTPKELVNHLSRVHHSLQRLKNGVEEVGCESSLEKDKELKSNTSKRKAKACVICEEKFSTPKELTDHLSRDHYSTKRARRSCRAPVTLGTSPEPDDSSDEVSPQPSRRRKNDDSVKSCPFCGQVNSASKSYSVHVRRCHNRQRYQCRLCEHQSRERYDFNIHIDHHKVWLNLSGKVPDGQGNISGLTSQMSVEGDERRDNLFGEGLADTTLSEADLAALGLMPRNKLDSSMRMTSLGEEQIEDQHGDGISLTDSSLDSTEALKIGARLKCQPCSKWFHRSKLPGHMLKVHNMKKVFQCRDVDCLEVFDILDRFVEHITRHTPKPMFHCGCTSCKKNNPNALNVDYSVAIKKLKMKNYYRKLVFKCITCFSRFPSQACLDKHMQTDSHSYHCHICARFLTSRNHFRSHMLTHKVTQKFLCEWCGKGFQTAHNLEKHTATHTGETPFICPTCKKGFPLKVKLDRHMNTVHSIVKPFACNHRGCSKAFTRKDKLKDHLLTHKDSPPFKCDYCTKGFFRKDNLQDHLILHTRKYKYQCKICSKGFMRPKALSQHVASMHPGQEDYVASQQVLKVASQATVANREHDYVRKVQTAAPPSTMQEQMWGKQPSMTGRQAFTTMLSTMQQQGNELGRPGPKMTIGGGNPTTLNTFVQILPQVQSGMPSVTMQTSLPIQNSAAATVASSSQQYQLTQSKLEQVKRQIEAVTQQLIAQQFGGNFLQGHH